jgi:hypothetical protein
MSRGRIETINRMRVLSAAAELPRTTTIATFCLSTQGRLLPQFVACAARELCKAQTEGLALRRKI